MLVYIFYFLLTPFLSIVIHIFKFFNNKIRIHTNNEKKSIQNTIFQLSQINREKIKVLLFHAASSGEFEQLKPILKRIDREKYFVIQSFTSPTVYNTESNSKLFNVCCYHPYDIWWKSYYFFSSIMPDIYCITRHDIWPTHLFVAKRLRIKTIYINANIHKGSIWVKPIMRSVSKRIFNQLFLCLVPSKRIFKYVSQIIDQNKIIISGDSRFDQVVDRYKKNLSKIYFPKKYHESFNIIFGSYDLYDEPYIFDSINKIYQYQDRSLKELNHRIILVPHEVDYKTVQRTKNNLQNLGFTYMLYSQLIKDISCPSQGRIIIVDQIGILADIYKYCKIAYVGSGFGQGVHSVIEPGVHGCAVGFGPNIKLLDEAQDIYLKDMGVMIKNKEDMINFLKLYQDKKTLNKLSNGIKVYINNNKNVSRKIINILEKYD